jgi:hypothetical protein
MFDKPRLFEVEEAGLSQCANNTLGIIELYTGAALSRDCGQDSASPVRSSRGLVMTQKLCRLVMREDYDGN